MYLKMSALAKKPRNVDKETRSQRLAITEARSQKDPVKSLNWEVLGYMARIQAIE